MKGLRNDAVNRVTVDEASEGQRIDNFLARHLKGVPKSHLYRILRSGEVRLNKGRVTPSTRVALGDEIRIPPIRTAVSALDDENRSGVDRTPGRARTSSGVSALGQRAASALAPRILHEDEALLALDKPAGLAVHGGSGISHGLIEQLRAARPEAKFLELVHRLDRDTSGVILVAKKRATLVALHAALREGRVHKRYLVLVRGRWRDAKRTVDLPLHKFSTQGGERRVRVEDDGQQAVTVFRRERVWTRHVPPLALLDAELQTGRTHQIRVHLTHLGYPLAGDDKYGDFEWNRELRKQGLKRMFLHARELGFTHPVSGVAMTLTAPLPGDLAAFIERVDREGGELAQV